MRIGYIRVSTEEQNTARQEVLLRELGVDELFIDKASGKNTDRPELKRMMNYVRKGDTVIVESISRFARNTKELLELVEQLTAKGVEFVSKKGSDRYHYPDREIHADRFRGRSRTGAGVHPPASARGHRHRQNRRKVYRPQTVAGTREL